MTPPTRRLGLSDLQLLCAVVFILVLGTGIVAPSLAPYAKGLGASGLAIGALYSSFYCVRLIAGPLIGKLGDREGPKRVLVYSLLLYPLVAFLYFSLQSVPGLLTARLCHGLASAMMLPMAMAYIGCRATKGREGSDMGSYNTALFLANGVGPIVGGLLVQRYGQSSAFASLFVLALVAVCAAFMLPNVESPKQPLELTTPEENGSKAWLAARKNARNALIGIGSIYFVNAVLSIYIISFYPLFLTERHISATYIGGILGVFNIIIALTQKPIGALCDRGDKTAILLGSAAVTAALLCTLGFTPGLVGIALVTLAMGITSSVAIAASSALAVIAGRESGMSSTMGLLSTATSAGMVVGPILSGVVSEHYSARATLFLCCAIWTIGTALFFYFYSFRFMRSSFHNQELKT